MNQRFHLHPLGCTPRMHHMADKGAALLAAMITVTLVATLASAALWQQWRGLEVEKAERQRAQASWILIGAQDWARLILREDAISRSGGSDHLNEPWAVPLQDSRLDTFLSADAQTSSAAQDEPLLQAAFLSGAMVDLQGRLNVKNLLPEEGQPSDSGKRAFAKLFDTLGLPMQELNALQIHLLQSVQKDRLQDQLPLPLVRVDQLRDYGLSLKTLEALRPFVTVLPQPTPVNLNTAPLEVVYASIGPMDRSHAQQLIEQRQRSAFKSLDVLKEWLGADIAQTITASQHSVSSSYFEINGRLRFEDLVVQERSVVVRENAPRPGHTRTLQRERVPVLMSTSPVVGR